MHGLYRTHQHFLLASALIAAFSIAAPTAELPPGSEIVQKVNARDDGDSLYRKMDVELTDKRGKSRNQETITYRKYYDGEKRSIIFYTSPANVKDTGFLSYDYAESDRDDDQWLYLPALRRVRRISASNRGDYYLGTDLTYEDIKIDTRMSERDYVWKTTGESNVDGHSCYVLEGTPVNEKTQDELGYSKYVAHVDKDIYLVRKHELWDTNGNALKTIHFRDVEKVQDIWTVHETHVENHKTGHTTRLTFSDVDYSTEIDDDVFTEQSLQRGVRSR